MKILVINSCGKAKKGSFETQAGCKELFDQSDRVKYIGNNRDKTHPARDLYTGQQATKIAKAVDILRDIGHDVDYYIISAGFCLIPEYFELPPYDCTFSGVGKRKLMLMSKNLKIRKQIQELQLGYDLIYLALGKSYLQTFELSDLGSKGDLIVHFDREKGHSSLPFVKLNDSEIIGKDENVAEFIEPIGNLVQSKGSILLNYALWLNKQQFIAFPDWWGQAIASIEVDPKSVQNSASLSRRTGKFKKDTTFQPVVRNGIKAYTGYDLMGSSKKAVEIVEKKVSQLTKKDIEAIYAAHHKLNPRDAKRENRKEWVEKYTDREAEIRKWAAWLDDLIDEVQLKTGDNKTDARSEIADAIRSEQEDLGFDKYLINPVRVALFSTFVDYMDNPEKLDESPAYKPRSDSNGPKADIFADSNIGVDAQAQGSVLTGTITNKSDYPMQSLKLKLLDKEEKKLEISDALGENFNVANGEVHVPFLKASMDGSPKTVKFKLEINAFYDFNEGYSLELSGEDTVAKEEVAKKFDFTG